MEKVNYFLSELENFHKLSLTVRNTDDIEALQRVRDHSITLGISSKKHSVTGSETPPPSPAEFGVLNDQRSPLESTNNKIPPTAEAESSDLTHHFDNSQG